MLKISFIGLNNLNNMCIFEKKLALKNKKISIYYGNGLEKFTIWLCKN